MSGAAGAAIRSGEAVACQPWPRFVLTVPGWDAMRAALAGDPGLVFQGMWADAAQVHALFLAPEPLLASVPVEKGLYGALSPWRPGAAPFERLVADLWGHRAADALDPRPWIDHGRWPVLHPMAARPVPNAGQPEPWEPLPAEGAGLHAVPVGPIRGGLAEPAALRLTAEGDLVVRLEARLGYAHKGTLLLMRGKPARAAARFAARLAADGTVAHSVAFARAVEAAFGIEAPTRAAVLRGVAAELERVGTHLADLAAIARLSDAEAVAGSCLALRETVLRAAQSAFGHRLMMDLVVPGGVAGDLTPEGAGDLLAVVKRLAADLPRVARACARAVSLACGVGMGVVDAGTAARFAPGGVVGRAAGQAGDARRALPYAPYDALAFAVPVREEGDAEARVGVCLAEIEASLGMLRDLLGAVPDGPVLASLPTSRSGEGLGWAEGPRGTVWHWVRLDGGAVGAAFARDPSWLLWPVLEAVAPGEDVAALPLVEATIGAGVSGVDL